MARVKCSRCDRHYSGMRLKCPYCGAHRSKKTVRKEQEEMSNSKFLVGGIILIALIAAVVVLIFVSTRGNNNQVPENEPEQETQEFAQDDGVESVEGTVETQPEVIIEEPQITSVSIVRNGEVQSDVTFNVGDTYEYSYETQPATTDELAVWTSDNEEVAVVLQNGEVTAISEGQANITVTIGEVSASMLVRVSE